MNDVNGQIEQWDKSIEQLANLLRCRLHHEDRLLTANGGPLHRLRDTTQAARIGDVVSDQNNNEPGLPLAILSSPKPSQATFYVAEGNGTAVAIKNKGYKPGQQLRGRKVFPHHKTVAGTNRSDYWTNEVGGEYRRVDDVCDSQNHSIKEWVKIGTKFTFKIHVTNLSQVELGALLWLLSLNRDQRQPDHFLRLNGGKPLGFGSVSPRIAATDLRPGARWKEYYFDLAGSQDTPDQDSQKILHDEAVKAYICAVVQAYGDMAQTEKLTDDRLLETFGKVPFIDSFLAAARGLDGPIHYPRTSTAPDPQGENFKWFDPKNSQSLPLLKTDGMDRLLYTRES